MTADSCTFSSCSSTCPPPAAVPRLCLGQPQTSCNEPSTALCHQPRPRPARRRRRSLNQNSRVRSRPRPWNPMHSWMFVVLVSILLCCQRVEAGNGHGSRRRTELLFDRREPPEPRMWLQKREETSHKAGHKSHGHSSGSANEHSGLRTASQESQIPLPQPFDTSLGNNFTAPSCPIFFNNFLTNETFNNCLPFSLLLQVRSHTDLVFRDTMLTFLKSDLQRLLCSNTLSRSPDADPRRNLQSQL